MAFNQTTETTGLSTTTFIAPTAGTYTVTGELSLPMITGGGPGSQVVVTVTTFSLVGLNTLTFNAPQTGPFVLRCTLTCPQLAQGATAPSQVVCTVSQNSTPIYVSMPGQEGFKAELSCTLGDTITVTTSSSAAIDSASLNAIKCTIGFSNGVS